MILPGDNRFKDKERPGDCMKIITKYLCGIGSLLLVFALGNYICYKSALKHFEEMQTNSEEKVYSEIDAVVTDKVESRYEELAERQQLAEDNVQADTSDYDTLSVQTIYQIENYDVVKDTTAVEYETLPEELVGLKREDADNYCKDYMKDIPAEEFLKGLQSMGVTSFSNERLIVRKIYNSSKVKYRYYLIAVDGEVVAYYGDKKTVYEYTGIETEGLHEEEKRALKKGIEVRDEDELYSILENYSS